MPISTTAWVRPCRPTRGPTPCARARSSTRSAPSGGCCPVAPTPTTPPGRRSSPPLLSLRATMPSLETFFSGILWYGRGRADEAEDNNQWCMGDGRIVASSATSSTQPARPSKSERSSREQSSQCGLVVSGGAAAAAYSTVLSGDDTNFVRVTTVPGKAHPPNRTAGVPKRIVTLHQQKQNVMDVPGESK